MIHNADAISIKNLFDVYYEIPEYQREYSWRLENWENLFNDLNESDKDYFLGTLICIVDGNIPMQVVDGQQRLTTLSIFRLSIFKKLNDKFTIFASDRAKNREFLNLESSLYDKKNKLQLQSNNKSEYEKLVDKIINNKNESFDNRLRIFKAYNYFEEKISDYTIDELFNLLDKINGALVVRIEVKSDQDAFILFESINNRGMPLSPIDLIKNKIFAQLAKNKIGDIEQNNKEWQKVLDSIDDFNDQVRFLRHYYHAFQNDEKIGIKGYTKATKSNIIKIYSEHIEKDVKFIFDGLIEKAKIYNQFVHPKLLEKNKYREKLIDLQILGIAPAYSLLLFLFSNFKDVDFANLLNLLENWFIRRHITDYPATNKLDQIFIDLISKINEQGYAFEVVESFLKNDKNYQSDEKFKERLINDDLYEINTGATRCLLTKLEKSKRTKESEVNFWETTGEKKSKLIWSIEHIMPQNPDKKTDWLNIDEEIRKQYVHKLGNLTLTCYNSNLSNKSFIDKISISENGNNIGLQSGNVKINDYFFSKDNWTIDDIKIRSEILVNEIMLLLQK